MSFGERFLRYPDLFPGRLAGEPWGAGELVLEAAGGPYLLSDLDTAAAEQLAAHFPGSCRAARPGGEPAAVRLRVLRLASEEFLPLDTRGWELTLDLDREPLALRIAGLGVMARLEWRPGLAGAVWTDAVGTGHLPGTIENVLRVAVAYRLADAGGALLHAAAVADGGLGAAFLGRSGAGKSTLARLCLAEGKTVLGDDLVAVAWRDGAPWLEPLPFGGDLRLPAPLPPAVRLRGLYRLVQGEEHAVHALGRGEALATLVACSPYVNRDPLAADALMSNLAMLLHSVPVRRLTFARRSGVWAAAMAEANATP